MKKNCYLFICITLIVLASCGQKKPGKTLEDLQAAYIGETTASAKYAAFAQKAKDDGKCNIAKLFEAASKSESIHAANHKKALEALGGKIENVKPVVGVKTTPEIVQMAIDGETYEVTTMYPQFIQDAKAEKVEKAEKSFTWAFDTEKKHQKFYTNAMMALKANSEDKLPAGYAVCPVCGNTYEIGSVDSKCSFCQTSKEKFISI
jgi:rubrerythrin